MHLIGRIRHLVGAVIVCGTISGLTPSALAQLDDNTASSLLEDFIHFTHIAKPDLARANLEALMGSGLENADFARLVDSGRFARDRFDGALDRAMRIAEADLGDLATEFAARVESGRLDLARDAARIDEAIGMLVGTLRQKSLGEARLEAAGEYAVPALLRVLNQGQDERLKAACRDVLRRIGLNAVMPLCVAMPFVDEPVQRTICELLGEIGYPHAAPFLQELAESGRSSGAIREVAMRSFRAVTGSQSDLSTQYANLSEQYFNGASFLVPNPLEDLNNVWSYDTHVGLVATSVPTPIFSQVMSMKMSSRSLQRDAGNARAVALFVAANLRRENRLPVGKADPIYGDNQYSPQFYARAFGTQICQDVLALALDAKDTVLVRDAIAALAETTGGSNLLSGGGRQPLLEALDYPDRRVQYETALTLGRALPESSFAGDIAVVPMLASAVRAGNQNYVVIVADDDEDRRVAAGRLADLGFTVVAQGPNLGVMAADLAAAPGADVAVVVRSNVASAKQTITDLSINRLTSVAPVLVLVAEEDMPRMRKDFQDDARVRIGRAGLDDGSFAAALDAVLVTGAGGRITETEAIGYAITCLDALNDIAISRATVYDISDAEPALLETLSGSHDAFRDRVAETLALIESERAQRALFDAALSAPDEGEQVVLLEQVAESVRRWGNRAQPNQIAGLLQIVANASGDLADAAARVHGALNLATNDAVQLIPAP